jgi:ABC-type nitrate/sulfonate/bicarbonate transport system substrate-binding protein
MNSVLKLAAGVLALLAFAGAARAQTSDLRVSVGIGPYFLPLYVMEELKLVEKRAAQAGLGDVKLFYRVVDDDSTLNEASNTALLAGALDIATGGVPGFFAVWDTSRNDPQTEVLGLSGVADTLGATTVIMAYATRRFYEANPQLSAAFIAAIDDAAQFIAVNKREAARIYIARAKLSRERTRCCAPSAIRSSATAPPQSA